MNMFEFIIPIMFYALFMGLVIFYTRRKFKTKKIILNRFQFAAHSFFYLQIIAISYIVGFPILVATLPFLPLSTFSEGVGLHFLFALFFNSIVSIVIFIGALLLYGPFIRKYYLAQPELIETQTPKTRFVFAKIIISIVILLGLFIVFGGYYVVRTSIFSFAVYTNNIELMESQKRFNSPFTDTGKGYAGIAKNTGNLAICDKINEGYRKARCYEDVDPEYSKSLQNCTLYTKHGDFRESKRDQGRCVMNKYVYERLESGENIQCDSILKDFPNLFPGGRNYRIFFDMRKCNALAKLQTVIKSGEAGNCRGYLTINRDPWLDFQSKQAYMVCVGHFVGSKEWNNACDPYTPPIILVSKRYNSNMALPAIANCTGFEKVRNVGRTLLPWLNSPMPPYNEDNL